MSTRPVERGGRDLRADDRRAPANGEAADRLSSELGSAAVQRRTGAAGSGRLRKAMRAMASFDMEGGIARCRIILSLTTLVAVYIDPTEPSLTRWLPLKGGAFTINRYWATVLIAHLAYSVALFLLHKGERVEPSRLARVATYGDTLFAAAIALVTEGTTSPFSAFFTFAVLTAGLRFGLNSALLVTTAATGLYALLIVVSAPHIEAMAIVMRAAYIAIIGYLVGYLGQERLNQEARIGELETDLERQRIARSLHDGYAQALAAVNLRLETSRELHRMGRHDEAMQELAALQAGVNREHDELRAYIRSLADVGATRATVPRPQHDASISIDARFHGPAAVVEHVLLLMLEGIRNVRVHARATKAVVEAREDGNEVRLTIDDDGIGFDDGAPPPWSMVSRVKECGGHIAIRGQGQLGAHLVIQLPQGEA